MRTFWFPKRYRQPANVSNRLLSHIEPYHFIFGGQLLNNLAEAFLRWLTWLIWVRCQLSYCYLHLFHKQGSQRLVSNWCMALGFQHCDRVWPDTWTRPCWDTDDTVSPLLTTDTLSLSQVSIVSVRLVTTYDQVHSIQHRRTFSAMSASSPIIIILSFKPHFLSPKISGNEQWHTAMVSGEVSSCGQGKAVHTTYWHRQ